MRHSDQQAVEFGDWPFRVARIRFEVDADPACMILSVKSSGTLLIGAATHAFNKKKIKIKNKREREREREKARKKNVLECWLHSASSYYSHSSGKVMDTKGSIATRYDE